MFKKRTLIVVGAGASNEVNIPTGSGLTSEIADLLNIQIGDGVGQESGDLEIYKAIRLAVFRDKTNVLGYQPYIEAAWKIRDAMPQAISVDHFIDSNQGNKLIEFCGKLAIVKAILNAERKSFLFFDPIRGQSNIDFKFIEKTWFTSFWRLLTEYCQSDQIEERLLNNEFVVFNYDRCIEHFIYCSLQNYYPEIDSEKAATIVRKIKIYHPYGTVGTLPWYKAGNSIGFGTTPFPEQLIDLHSQIKTFTEGTCPDSSDIINIRNSVAESSIVLFLGFAYHPLNLEIIRPTENIHTNPEDVKYYGTAKGISQNDINVIVNDLAGLGGVKTTNIFIKDGMTCIGLFHEYRRSFSIS